MSTAALWEVLSGQERHQLRYPAEAAVRFLTKLKPGSSMLDVGCGAGRHMKTAHEMGLRPTGLDITDEAVRKAQSFGPVRKGTASALPFEAGQFDAALAYGSIYYNLPTQVASAVSELHRVLAPGGIALVTFRSFADYRYGRGNPSGNDCFQLQLPDEPEDGMTCMFHTQQGVAKLFGAFASIELDLLEYTHQTLRRTSEWLLTARR